MKQKDRLGGVLKETLLCWWHLVAVRGSLGQNRLSGSNRHGLTERAYLIRNEAKDARVCPRSP